MRLGHARSLQVDHRAPAVKPVAAHAEAESLAAKAGAGPDSEIGREIAATRALLDDGAARAAG